MSSPCPTPDSDLPSSQDNHLPSGPLSSPSQQSTEASKRRKEKRPPSITPRKFKRFFAPRPRGSSAGSSARHALFEITGPNLNRNAVQSSPLGLYTGQDSSPAEFARDLKRRKLIHTPDTTAKEGNDFLEMQESGSGDVYLLSSPCEKAAPISRELEEDQVPPKTLKRITPITRRGLAGQLLSLSIGGPAKLGRQHYVYPINDWQDHTASFYSGVEDTHVCTSIEGPGRTIPFCATSCNTNTLVAIGDEEGRVTLVESSKSAQKDFKDVFHAWRVHMNAIIDMTFSDDDTRLATGSGDQSARIIDMATQTTISILGNHNASLKQVRFQPGSSCNNVIATSSRDGSIQIWDLRVNGYDGPSRQIYVPITPGTGTATRLYPYRTFSNNDVQYGRSINQIWDAHRPKYRQMPTISGLDTPARGEVAGRGGDVSVTAIQFLPPGQEHLLLSASEADSSIFLWDTRFIQSKRKIYNPISSTKLPQSHSKFRNFGLCSLDLSGDGSRLYSLCKDNTVYAYSVSHLVLGHAPEFSESRYAPRATQEGLGPLYGFRHPRLHATSFYVKSAIRKAKDGKCEMLAVGSSDCVPILFPTAERYLLAQQSRNKSPDILEQRPTLRRMGSNLLNRPGDTIPISTNGTALVRGHNREVGDMSWTYDGELVTVGDDFIVRIWREGEEAKDLRENGEQSGRRWAKGWADVNPEYDQDDA